jgi:hypothetical protein
VLDSGASKPTLFRSYKAPKSEAPDCTIWQAARATSATPALFKSIVIGKPGASQTYTDGGTGLNNPTGQVLEEAEDLFPHRQVTCIISIGTGQVKTSQVPKPSPFQRVVPLDVISAIATDCEITSEAMAQRFRTTPNFYFRFNAELGLQEAKMAQWDQLDRVAVHTMCYLQMVDVKKRIGATVDAILHHPEHVTTAQIGTGLSNFNNDLSHLSAQGRVLLPQADNLQLLSVCII